MALALQYKLLLLKAPLSKIATLPRQTPKSRGDGVKPNNKTASSVLLPYIARRGELARMLVVRVDEATVEGKECVETSQCICSLRVSFPLVFGRALSLRVYHHEILLFIHSLFHPSLERRNGSISSVVPRLLVRVFCNVQAHHARKPLCC